MNFTRRSGIGSTTGVGLGTTSNAPSIVEEVRQKREARATQRAHREQGLKVLSALRRWHALYRGTLRRAMECIHLQARSTKATSTSPDVSDDEGRKNEAELHSLLKVAVSCVVLARFAIMQSTFPSVSTLPTPAPLQSRKQESETEKSTTENEGKEEKSPATTADDLQLPNLLTLLIQGLQLLLKQQQNFFQLLRHHLDIATVLQNTTTSAVVTASNNHAHSSQPPHHLLSSNLLSITLIWCKLLVSVANLLCMSKISTVGPLQLISLQVLLYLTSMKHYSSTKSNTNNNSALADTPEEKEGMRSASSSTGGGTGPPLGGTEEKMFLVPVLQGLLTYVEGVTSSSSSFYSSIRRALLSQTFTPQQKQIILGIVYQATMETLSFSLDISGCFYLSKTTPRVLRVLGNFVGKILTIAPPSSSDSRSISSLIANRPILVDGILSFLSSTNTSTTMRSGQSSSFSLQWNEIFPEDLRTYRVNAFVNVLTMGLHQILHEEEEGEADKRKREKDEIQKAQRSSSSGEKISMLQQEYNRIRVPLTQLSLALMRILDPNHDPNLTSQTVSRAALSAGWSSPLLCPRLSSFISNIVSSEALMSYVSISWQKSSTMKMIFRGIYFPYQQLLLTLSKNEEDGGGLQEKKEGGSSSSNKGFFAQWREDTKKKNKNKAAASTSSAAMMPLYLTFSSIKTAQSSEEKIIFLRSVIATFEIPHSWFFLSQFYLSMFHHGKSTAIISSLLNIAYDFLPALWQYCKEKLYPILDALLFPVGYCLNIKKLKKSSSGSNKKQQDDSSSLYVLITEEMQIVINVTFSLLAMTYTYFLTVIDDEEFSEMEIPFRLDTVKDIVFVATRILYGLALHSTLVAEANGTTESENICVVRANLSASFINDECGLRSSLRSMLRQIKGRSRRKKFIPPEETESYWFLNHNPIMDEKVFPAPSSTKKSGSPGILPSQQGAMRLLFEWPSMVPFSFRVGYLREFIALDRQKNAVDKVKYGIKIRRTHFLQDGYEQIMALPKGDAPLLRARLHVQFIDVHGAEEPGIDAGGVFKEFMELLVKQAFNPEFGLFQTLPDSNQLFPNPHAPCLFGSAEECMHHYRFLGRVLAKAIYESSIVSLHFAPFFLNNLLGRGNSLDDLKLLDPQLHHSLMMLKEMSDVSDAFLYFVVEDQFLGQVVMTELVDGGKDILVTNENVIKYLHLLSHHKLTGTMQNATRAFLSGLSDLLDSSWINLFDPGEFQQLVSGGHGLKLDVADLRKYTRLVGGYTNDSRTITLLWEVLAELEEEDQGKFLQFVTGSSHPPLLGFQSMNPPFSIRRTEDNSGVLNYMVDIDRLPSASTCFNLLKLPPYKNKTNLKEKVLASIRSGAGFDLS